MFMFVDDVPNWWYEKGFFFSCKKYLLTSSVQKGKCHFFALVPVVVAQPSALVIVMMVETSVMMVGTYVFFQLRFASWHSIFYHFDNFCDN